MCQELRSQNIPVEMDGQGKSMKAQLKYANKINAKYVIILGDDELVKQEAIIRDMETSEQHVVPLMDASKKIYKRFSGMALKERMTIRMETMQGLHRTHGCGTISEQEVGKEVVLCGWVERRRDHGGLIFLDLRDRSGVVQVVASPDHNVESFHKAEDVRNEYVLCVRGKITKRDEAAINPNLPTGAYEMYCEELRVLNSAKTPPFYIQDDIDVDENIRLKYRYLDLRRPEMQRNLILRHKVTKAMRDFFDSRDFLEIETPMLTKSTPEGARDYLVPSRVNAGTFYALPQSPQIFKQILMVAGYEKYFQIVRCFRDEDLRADRQPEFTQLDLEMSFVDEEDIYSMLEEMVAHVFKTTLGKEITLPMPRITWDEAMDKYGSDKPDLRFDMAFTDVTDLVKDTEFKVFRSVIDNGGVVKGIVVPGDAGIPRRELDDLVEYVNRYGAKGLAWACFNEDGSIKSQIMKFLGEDTIRNIGEKMGAKGGDLVLMIADKPATVARALGELRLEMARRMNMIDPDKLAFTWVTDFPMFEYNEDEKRYVAMHHPFTMPRHEDLDKLESDPGSVKAIAYDMVLNGVEIGGGSLRIYQSDVQEKVFKAIGLSEEEAKSKFGFMLDAFQYGAPPHAGCAFGLDRLVMLMAKRQSIRDVIAFPKTQSASDVMSQAPSEVEPKQLKELHIKPDIEEEEEQSLV
ncbi:MAG: aspartate--tRNA ligase [Veillonella sp.]|nr:aspartate--tRNA ligase [Veillonella sp.]MDU2904171.1 aspartate--tRNA ligase [Veillonella sp.]